MNNILIGSVLLLEVVSSSKNKILSSFLETSFFLVFLVVLFSFLETFDPIINKTNKTVTKTSRINLDKTPVPIITPRILVADPATLYPYVEAREPTSIAPTVDAHAVILLYPSFNTTAIKNGTVTNKANGTP